MNIYFNQEHQTFRNSVRQFIQSRVLPEAPIWEKQGKIPRSIWREMGELGYLGINFSEKYGGSEADFFFTVVFLEELGRSGFGGFAAAITV
ncbi:MAG TPA: acyl-CoA dehydrogenase family protein, partial [Oceanospirillales bacterium]|nr:acyl-CoA dehydrogenase family protein [Oceanospirillales bacterium]